MAAAVSDEPSAALTMSSPTFVASDEIRSQFSQALSALYRQEVPQYGALLDLVAKINAQTLGADPALNAQLAASGELPRLNVERHGAIRLGTAAELFTLRRAFALMGMVPVAYYDLSVAGVPVHSTAFRATDPVALACNPFRVFTSLLRLELIKDAALREEAAAILARRRIFSEQALALTDQAEQAGGLTPEQAGAFVAELLHTFRWQQRAVVDHATYQRMHAAHRLIADIVCFPGPHINHLTPRTLDIDAVQAAMPAHGMAAKAQIEGPPRRDCPVLLRQTSFQALQEPVLFSGSDGPQAGAHTARFGEVEQRGAALTRSGRDLYDRLLAQAQAQAPQPVSTGDAAPSDRQNPAQRLQQVFQAFPDDETTLRQQGLAFFHYQLSPAGEQATPVQWAGLDLEAAISEGLVRASPITYEDFLPVSAAGIFQSNLGGERPKAYAAGGSQAAFEQALGCAVGDELALYAQAQRESLAQVEIHLNIGAQTR
jgi:uncharacterized glyoxalase superfamily metalloenzyme YdcJ